MNRQAQNTEKEPAEDAGRRPATTETPAATTTFGLSNQAMQSDAKAAAPANTDAPAPAAGGWSVDDTATSLTPGQMKKSDFLAELKGAVCRSAADALAGTQWSEKGCPYIEYWFGFYQSQDARHVERAVLKYGSIPGAVAAHDYTGPVAQRVGQAVKVWLATGQSPGFPAGMMMGMPGIGAPADARAVQPKLRDGATAKSADPQAVSAALGEGRPLAGDVSSRLGAAFGRDFSRTRLHTDGVANRLSSNLDARAFAVGDHIAFASGEYRPGTLIGDALIAHELAHVAQQQGGGTSASGEPDQALEGEADMAAAGAVLSIHGGALPASIPQPRPMGGRGPRLSRCSSEKVPELTTTQAKVDWVNRTLAGSSSLFDPRPGGVLGRSKGQAIVDVLSTLPSTEYMDIQSQVDMSALLDELNDFETVRLGTLGPLTGDARTRMNKTRADYLYTMTSDRGPAEGQIVAHWMFSSMYGDDILEVLALLAGDQHLYNTVDEMPIVLDLFKERGIDRSMFQDRGWKAKDIGSGILNFGKHFLGSSEIGRESKSTDYMIGDLEMPQSYQDALVETGKQELLAALTPGNIALGAVNQIGFGIPGAVIGVVRGTASGIKDIAQGHVEAGTEKLTGSAIFVIGLVLGVRAFRQSARLAALMELTAEGEAAFVELRTKIGQRGIDRVAKYVQANSEAAFFVREKGVAAIEALERAGGDVAKARASLPPAPVPSSAPARPLTAAPPPPVVTPKTPPPPPRTLVNATTTDIAQLKDDGFVYERMGADGRTACYRNPTTGQQAVVTLRSGGPRWMQPNWGRSRVEAELRDRGFSLDRQTRGEGGLLYRNPETGEEMRIMPRPSEVFRDEPIEKHLNDSYYRYRPRGDAAWGDHTTIPDKK